MYMVVFNLSIDAIRIHAHDSSVGAFINMRCYLLWLRLCMTGRISASKALRSACEDVKDTTNHMHSTFQRAVQAKREKDRNRVE